MDQTEQSLSPLPTRMDCSKTGKMNSCQICLQAEAKYSCPRCNSPYCGLKCYQSPSHGQCSEAFYRQCVTEELGQQDTTSAKTKHRMLEALKNDYDKNDDPLDSDDEEDLHECLAGIDLDDSEQVWSCLTPEEHRQFKQSLESGELIKLVPIEERDNDVMW